MYDETFYLVTDNPNDRVDSPGAELYDEDYEPVGLEVLRSAGGRIRIVMVSPEQFEENRAYVEAGVKINWEDPE